MEFSKKGYHITKKSNLYSIKRDGLQPRIGRNSDWADEHYKFLYFTDDLDLIYSWKVKIYQQDSFDNYAILSFDLENIDYTKRTYSSGECFTKMAILPENINVVKFNKKNTIQDTISLGDIEKIFLNNIYQNAIEILKNDYEISEQPITELSIEKPVSNANNKDELINKLADYEHKKWAKEYDSLTWTGGDTNSDGSITIRKDKAEDILKYSTLDYKNAENWYKSDIRKTVMETFFIMQEYDFIHEFGISDEEIIAILEQAEYDRRNRWNKHMLSLCSIKDGQYIIPSEKAKLWEQEKDMQYSELSEAKKQSDRKEVETIFLKIKKHVANKQNLTNLQNNKEKQRSEEYER